MAPHCLSLFPQTRGVFNEAFAPGRQKNKKAEKTTRDIWRVMSFQQVASEFPMFAPAYFS